VLFVGSFGHAPNETAAVRLAADILPQLKVRHPDVALSLVGHAPTPRVEALRGANVEVHGNVPDVAPHLDSASVVAVPLTTGGGMRVKVLEALAAGKATVCSPRAAEGLDVRDGVHLLLADTDAQFVDAIDRLLRRPMERRELGSRARQWVQAHASAERSARLYSQLYVRLCSRAGDLRAAS
jgi:glycosyltransferase involved in cell wall biosynthesis